MRATACTGRNRVEARYPDLEGRHVLVTGGGSGIGASIVEHFARQGARVGFLDIAEEPSRALAERLGEAVRFELADLTDIEATRAAIARLRESGPFGGVVNNAAHDQRHALEDVTVDYWDARMAVNLRHQFFVSQAVAEDLKKDGAGTIVNMGSTSWMLGQGGMAAYTAAKSAVLGLTRSLARDLGPFGVRANSIAPGWIMTERQREKWVTPEALADTLERQCLKRELEPADVARTVLFLTSGASAGCTAQDFIVDGGMV